MSILKVSLCVVVLIFATACSREIRSVDSPLSEGEEKWLGVISHAISNSSRDELVKSDSNTRTWCPDSNSYIGLTKKNNIFSIDTSLNQNDSSSQSSRIENDGSFTLSYRDSAPAEINSEVIQSAVVVTLSGKIESWRGYGSYKWSFPQHMNTVCLAHIELYKLQWKSFKNRYETLETGGKLTENTKIPSGRTQPSGTRVILENDGTIRSIILVRYGMSDSHGISVGMEKADAMRKNSLLDAGSHLFDFEHGIIYPIIDSKVAEIRLQSRMNAKHPEIKDPKIDAKQFQELAEQEANGNFSVSLFWLIRALSVISTHLGHEHPDNTNLLIMIRENLRARGLFALSQYYENRLMAVNNELEKTSITDAFRQAKDFHKQEEYASATEMYKKAAKIAVTLQVTESLLYRQVLEGLEEVYIQQKLGEKATDIDRKINTSKARSAYLNGIRHRIQENYADSEFAFRVALGLLDKDKEREFVTTILINLGELYQKANQFNKATRFYETAAQRLALSDSETVTSEEYLLTNQLATLYSSMGKLDRLEQVLVKAVDHARYLFGPDSSPEAISLNNLGVFYQRTGEYAKAEKLHANALRIRRKIFGNNIDVVGSSLNNLASIYSSTDRMDLAKKTYEEALGILRTTVGEKHSWYRSTLFNLGLVNFEIGLTDVALEQLKEESNLSETVLTSSIIATDHDQIQSVLKDHKYRTQNVLNLAVELKEHNEWTTLALNSVLRYKGRALDLLRITQRATRASQNELNTKTANSIAKRKSALSELAFSGNTPDGGSDENILEKLDDELDSLQYLLAVQSGALQQERDTVDVDMVLDAIPKGALLLEFIKYRKAPSDTDKGGSTTDNYVLIIVNQMGTTHLYDLGDATQIDRLVREFRTVVANVSIRRDSLKFLLKQLSTLLFGQVGEIIENSNHLIVSPDSLLNLFPFEALIDQQNRYLIETHLVTYLTSGRDLVNVETQNDAGRASVLMGDPEYIRGSVNTLENSALSRGLDFGGLLSDGNKDSSSTDYVEEDLLLTVSESVTVDELMQNCCEPLPGTGEEVKRIADILGYARTFTGRSASKQALLSVDSPNILHIASHGYFLSSQQGRSGRARVNNPLLRSGLLLSGYDVAEKKYSGVLTALEISNLNLTNSQLIVLSACQTGNGDIHDGEGVFGLKRSLKLAGSHTQVLSLWDVADKPTIQLMIDFYTQLDREGRGDALRVAKLKLLADPVLSHPFFWSGFVLSGNWKQMNPTSQ